MYMLLYVLLVFGLLYSIDSESGLSKVQTQISLLIFPLFLGGSILTSKYRQKCLNYFLTGVLITVLICLGHAFYRAIIQGGLYVVDEFGQKNSVFFYQQFSSLLDFHPTYFSLYLGIGLFCLMERSFLKINSNLVLRIFTILFLFVALFLTSSKAGIFSFIAVTAGFFVYKALIKRSRIHLGLLLILILGFFVMYTVSPVLQKRSAQGITGFKKVFLEHGFINESTSIRFHLWILSYNIAKESPILGYGTGSTKKALNEKCLKFYAFSTCERLRNKNSHNQFLEFLVANGSIFVLVFTFALILGLVRAFRNQDRLLGLFLAFMTINFLFESTLQRERGVVLFMLFVVILSVSHRASIKKVNLSPPQ
ncbi:O-antigen ligase family protein [uncultured Zobellia sp.]|uniref:O-antigen ligase family protein n=1 Tax=uncultured Zobellia sp. TaxID=255433 RepID=UPI0025913306|nr:O-antigen ligase family protein [uncultured Zobellia sp.]